MSAVLRDIPARCLSAICVAACVVALAISGQSATTPAPGGQLRASLDADGSQTLDFADIANQLDREHSASFIRFYVDAIDGANRGSVQRPIPREASGTQGLALAAPSRERDSQQTSRGERLIDVPACLRVLVPSGRTIALPEPVCCVKCVRGPPALA